VAPCQRHKDNLSKLEPIFTALLLTPWTAGLMEAVARRTLVRRPTLSTWKTNLCANPSCRLQRIHCSFVKQPLTGQQWHGLATGIADDRMDKGLFDSAATFQSDAM
jgi:hypothetical protein